MKGVWILIFTNYELWSRKKRIRAKNVDFLLKKIVQFFAAFSVKKLPKWRIVATERRWERHVVKNVVISDSIKEDGFKKRLS